MCSARIRQNFIEHLDLFGDCDGPHKDWNLVPIVKLYCKLRLFDAITKTMTYTAKIKLPSGVWLSDMSVRPWKRCLDHVATPQFVGLFEIVVSQVQKPLLF